MLSTRSTFVNMSWVGFSRAPNAVPHSVPAYTSHSCSVHFPWRKLVQNQALLQVPRQCSQGAASTHLLLAREPPVKDVSFPYLKGWLFVIPLRRL